MTDKLIISRKEIEALQRWQDDEEIANNCYEDDDGCFILYDDLRALLDKAEVSEPDISYYGILDTGTVIDVNDTYDESNNKLQSLIKHDIDYKSATIIPLYTSLPDQSAKIDELEAEIAKLNAIIEDMKVVDNVFSK